MLNSFIIGAAAGIIGGVIVAFWGKKKQQITDAIAGVTDKIEARTGIDIPDSWEERYAEIVKTAVDLIDASFSNKKFWRDIIKIAVSKKPDLAVDKFLEAFSKIDWAESLAAQIPEEFLELFNWAKEQIATKNVKAAVRLSQMPPAIAEKSDEEVAKDIRAAVVIHRTEQIGNNPIAEVSETHKNVTEKTLEDLIKESQERQVKLRAH